MSEPTITLEREGAVAKVVLSNPPLNLFTDNAFNELMDCLDRGRGLRRQGAGLVRRGRHLQRRRRRARLPARSSTPTRPPGRERDGRAADRGGAAARGARDPDHCPDPWALPHRGARDRARLRHLLGRGVVEVRPRRGRRRAHPRRGRYAADGRARRSGQGARVRDDGGPLRRRDARALGSDQPGRPRRHRAREGAAVRRSASPPGRPRPTPPPSGSCARSATAGSSAPTRSPRSSLPGCSRARICKERCVRSLRMGLGKPSSRASEPLPSPGAWAKKRRSRWRARSPRPSRTRCSR